ncbi:M4 family metallopeptidase [Nocardioides piscis]|uniref:Neutral metalloproteinase n=1 Tax=Nocardioides piscis TaxID=2714938 RepID=A0A6G7YEN5_9ACTN|nr:M4 family metallopeptidase [Nocardioides piscis]QIK75282.1 M4 family metallopeptidase [Nocardioides piscis]
MTSRMPACTFVPPWLLARLGAERSLDLDDQIRALRSARAAEPHVRAASAVGVSPWTVHDADNATQLPGRPVRSAGQPTTVDVAVDEAAAGIEQTLAMFASGFGRASYDDAGAPVTLVVHYGHDYANAFWDGRHLVFGDGDGMVFERLTKAGDVLAHEFGHAVIEHAAGLVYRDQPGALNESLADVFAACFKQRLAGESAAEADWLIGEGLFVPGVRARALRDMASPGTAFDDPALGSDPQVAHLDDFVVTTDDNGGVHLNSGIPNRAFHLAATAIGGTSLEGAGQIWYSALTRGGLRPDADFSTFAAATVAAAGDHAEAVMQAWASVGVGLLPPRRPTGPPQEPADTPAPVPAVVRVRRSGGFAGRVQEGEIAVDARVRSLLERVDLDAAAASASTYRPMPDMFVYTFQIAAADPVTLPEQALTAGLHDLATLVLGSDER